jgi:hypothetical protein
MRKKKHCAIPAVSRVSCPPLPEASTAVSYYTAYGNSSFTVSGCICIFEQGEGGGELLEEYRLMFGRKLFFEMYENEKNYKLER